MNLYGFGGGDPVNFSDPFGLYADPVTVAVVVAGAGNALAAPVVAVGASIVALGAAALAPFATALEGYAMLADMVPSSGGLHRPYIRNGVRAAVEANAKRTSDGRFIDANTGQPIDGKYDLGHKYGHEFRTEKARAEREGLSQAEFNNRMNDPSLYQVESPSSNRSRSYEKKP